MEKVIQFLTSTQGDAYTVVETLKKLDESGDISLDVVYVLEKDESGKTQLKDSKGEVADNTLFGTFAGGLIGLLGGPAGALLGSSLGLLTGSLIDLNKAGNTEDYLAEVANKIPNGKSLVVSHVYEDWETPIDSKLASIAEISRIDIDEEVDKAVQEEIAATNKEIDDMEAGIKEAAAEKKAELQQKIANLKAKNAARKEELSNKVAAQKNAYKNWFEKLKTKLKGKKS